MANEQNLKPGEYKLTLEEQKKGGKRSGEVRREKKLIREYLNDFLYGSADLTAQKQLAAKMGVSEDSPFIESLTKLAILTSMKKGFTLDDLKKLIELTGQELKAEDETKQEEDFEKMLKALKGKGK